MKIVLAFLCMFAVGCSTWAPRDQWLLGANVALRSADAYQTEWAMENGFHETNPLIGRNPSDERIICFTAIALGATWWLAQSLDGDTRTVALIVTALPAAYAVAHNYDEGVRP